MCDSLITCKLPSCYQPSKCSMKTKTEETDEFPTYGIISGHQLKSLNYNNALNDNCVNPFVTVKIKGIDIDEQKNKTKQTDVIKNNGFNP